MAIIDYEQQKTQEKAAGVLHLCLKIFVKTGENCVNLSRHFLKAMVLISGQAGTVGVDKLVAGVLTEEQQ